MELGQPDKMIEFNRFKIRFMQPNEAGRLAELIAELQNLQQLAGIERVPKCDEVKRELLHCGKNGQMIANNKGTFIAVAVDNQDPNDAKIVGYLIYSQAYSVVRGGYMFLNSFFIEEPYRRLGLGSKFINFMRIHCRLLGCCGCDIGVMKDNLSGQRFYKRFGAYLVDKEYQLNLSPI